MKDPVELGFVALIDSIADLFILIWPFVGNKMKSFVANIKKATPKWAAVMANLGKFLTGSQVLLIGINAIITPWPKLKDVIYLYSTMTGIIGTIVTMYARSITVKEDKPVAA